MSRLRKPCLLAVGLLLGAGACSSNRSSPTCSTTATCEALSARVLHQAVLLPEHERIVTGGVNGRALSIVFDRYPTDPAGFNAIVSRPSKAEPCTTTVRAGTGRVFCFTRYRNGIAASFQAKTLRYVILWTDQPGQPPLGKADASAIVSL